MIPPQKRCTLRFVPPTRDDRGSLPMVMLVMLVGMAIAALLLPMAIVQNTVTRFDDQRAMTLHAAESGLDVAVGQIRAARKKDKHGQMVGDVTALPCGPLTGSGGAESGASYSVTITYFTADPRGHDKNWRDSREMTCSKGSGVFYRDKSGNDFLIPSFALLTSTGGDEISDSTRTLQATYTVYTTNANIAGGALPLFPESDSKPKVNYCLDAGALPSVGSTVVVQPCVLPVPAEQRWAYLTNLTIQLTAAVGDPTVNANETGLCLKSPDGLNQQITLAACPADKESRMPGDATWDLQWSINNVGHFEGSKTDESGLNGSCLHVDAQKPGETLQRKSCNSGTTNPHQAFNPMRTVGAGQAGPANDQIVNFFMFGRCLDVTNQSTATGDNGGTFLILYPCKQNPNPSAVAWNQKFKPGTKIEPDQGPATVKWVTRKGSVDYCLTSPMEDYYPEEGDDPEEDAGEHHYVHVSKCSDAKSAAQTWTRFGKFDSNDDQLPDKKKYTLVDSAGLCMSSGPTNDQSEDQYNKNLKVIVTKCDGNTGQEWNADPRGPDATLQNLNELAGSAADG